VYVLTNIRELNVYNFCTAEDRKGKGPRVSSLHALPPASTALPQSPAEAKQIPGLPGVIIKASKDKQRTKQQAKNAVAGPSNPQKRKAAAGVGELTPNVQLYTGLQDVVPSDADRDEEAVRRTEPKRQRQEKKVALPGHVSIVPEAPAAPPAGHGHVTLEVPRAQQAAPAAVPLTFSALPGESELATALQQSHTLNAELRALCQQLQAENAELKDSRVRQELDELLAGHDARVEEHCRKASELANYWRDEAARLAEQLEQAGAGDLAAEARTLRSDLATARQAIMDMERAAAEKDKEINVLQRRNAFLERHARVPEVSDKCTVTDVQPTATAAVQTREGVQLMQARAMAPEGAAASSMYTYSQPAGGRQQEDSFTLPGQRTAARPARNNKMGMHSSLAGSDMQLETLESVQGRAHDGRRLSMPAVAGGTMQHQLLAARRATLDPQQIQFYSNSRSRGLDAVQEEPEDDPPAQAAPQPTSTITSGTLLPEEEALVRLTGFVGEPKRGNGFRFTHVESGFAFELYPIPPDKHGIDQMYRLVSWGSAKEAFRVNADASTFDLLGGDFEFKSRARLELFTQICNPLKNMEK
jgi:hypothetical protein